MRRIVLVFIFYLSFLPLSLLHAQTPVSFYVAPYGNDANPGTEALPFKTITAAQAKVRTINKTMDSDIVVYLRGGTYRLSAPLQFTDADSGYNGHTVIYKNYGTEVPELNGAARITNWVKEGTKWKAPVNSSLMAIYPRQFYVNGTPAVRARNPENTNSAYRGAFTCLDAVTCGFLPGAIPITGWRNISDVEFVGTVVWKMARCGVNRIQSNVMIFDEPCYTYTRNAPVVNLFNWVENAYELLDQPGEWYLDRAGGYVYYQPRTAAETADMNLQDAELPYLGYLINGIGTVSSPIQNITFQGINFSYTTWTVPNTGIGFVETQANFPQGVLRIPGGVSFANSTHLTFDHNVFRFMGGVGLDLSGTVQNTTILGNHVYNVSGTGVQIGNTTDALQTDTTKMVSNNTIKDNLIHNVTAEYQSGVGLFIGFSRNSVVDHNEIHHVNYTGISSGWGWFNYLNGTYAQNNKIQNNSIYQYALAINDVGGIYSLGQQPGSEYSGNLIQSPGITAAEGLYIDDGSRGISIHDNASLSNHNQIKGGDHTVTNNWWLVAPQISQYNQGLPSYYGFTCADPTYGVLCTWGNIVQTNNHVITTAAQLPASFATAGLEAAYQAIRNPREPVEVVPTTKIGDANADGVVNGQDYIIWLNHYGSASSGVSSGDFNNDNTVNGQDYILWLNHYGT